MFRPADVSPRLAPMWVAAVVLVGVLIRVGFGLSRPVDVEALAALPDQVEYLSLARSIHDGATMALADPRFDQPVLAQRMPGYPALLALFSGDLRSIRIAQAGLDGITILAAIALARRWLAPRWSLGVGVCVALDPFLIFFTSLVLTETLFTTLLTAGVALLVRGAPPVDRSALWKKHLLWWLGLSLLLLGIYVRPSAFVLPAALAFVSGWVSMPTHPRRFPIVMMTIALTLLVLLPWAIRNQRLLGSMVWTTTNGGVTLYDGLHPGADGSSNQAFVERHPAARAMNELDRDHYFRTLARQWAADHPLRTLRLGVDKFARTWSPVPLSPQFGSSHAHVIAGLVFAGPMLLLAVLGLFVSTLPPRARWMLITAAVVVSAMHVISVGSLRYRVPLHPQLIVLAIGCLAALASRRTARP
jgi:hypothetical protein